ncbi:MAG: DNA mismatch endonuclease Vsr [Alphaproteobacteria bacterium]|nr:DNA mismatch endonuclease Vsr [Alphaproteobacteria bacterium]
MVDIHDKKKRSAIMSAVRSKNNRSTELKILAELRRNRIFGWRRHLSLPGHPDFAWREQKVALFVDGCFWHGCKKCKKIPKSNVEFWVEKVRRNRVRDRRYTRALQRKGWKVIRVTECQIANSRGLEKAIVKIVKTLRLACIGSYAKRTAGRDYVYRVDEKVKKIQRRKKSKLKRR